MKYRFPESRLLPVTLLKDQEYSGPMEEQRVTRQALGRRPWLSRGHESKLRNTWESEEVEARVFTRLITLPRRCISYIPWLKSEEKQSCEIHVMFLCMCLCDCVCMFVYTYNTSKELIVNQTNCISIVFGVGVCLHQYRARTWEAMAVQWFPNWCHNFNGVIPQKKIGVFSLGLNCFNFQSMCLVVLFFY